MKNLIPECCLLHERVFYTCIVNKLCKKSASSCKKTEILNLRNAFITWSARDARAAIKCAEIFHLQR
jgi:hypothetical protein